MINAIMPLIKIYCLKYRYTVNPDGTRNIDTREYQEETFSFRFDIDSLEKIIFRDGPRTIIVDNKTMSFIYSPDGEYKETLLEDNEYVYLVRGKNTFIDQCKNAYIKQKMIERFALLIDAIPENNTNETIIYDEFE